MVRFLAIMALAWYAVAKSQDPNDTGEDGPAPSLTPSLVPSLAPSQAPDHVTCFQSGTMDYSQIILAPAYLRDKATNGEHRRCSLTNHVEKDLACFDTARVTFENNAENPTKAACTDAANAVEAIIAKCCPGCTSSKSPVGLLGAYENDQYRVHVAPRAQHCEEDETIFSGAEPRATSWLALTICLLSTIVMDILG